MQSETCLVVVFHGSRLPATSEHAQALLQGLHLAKPDVPVRLGFLSMCDPSFSEVLQEAGREGFSTIVVWPLFTLPGRHTETDIPKVVAECATMFPDTKFRLLPCLGTDPAFLCWLRQRVHDTVADRSA